MASLYKLLAIASLCLIPSIENAQEPKNNNLERIVKKEEKTAFNIPYLNISIKDTEFKFAPECFAPLNENCNSNFQRKHDKKSLANLEEDFKFLEWPFNESSMPNEWNVHSVAANGNLLYKISFAEEKLQENSKEIKYNNTTIILDSASSKKLILRYFPPKERIYSQIKDKISYPGLIDASQLSLDGRLLYLAFNAPEENGTGDMYIVDLNNRKILFNQKKSIIGSETNCINLFSEDSKTFFNYDSLIDISTGKSKYIMWIAPKPNRHSFTKSPDNKYLICSYKLADAQNLWHRGIEVYSQKTRHKIFSSSTSLRAIKVENDGTITTEAHIFKLENNNYKLSKSSNPINDLKIYRYSF